MVLLCTTDDPVDPLEHHRAIAADDGFGIQVLPAWRPDKAMAVDASDAFNAWVDRLAAAIPAPSGMWQLVQGATPSGVP